MQEKIETKLKEYKDNFPKNQSFKTWLSKSNLWSWIYSVFRVQGQKVSKPCIVDLLEGTLRDEAPLSCYSFVQSFKEVTKDMGEESLMQSSPSVKLYKRWAEMMSCRAYRKSNPVVFEFGLIPCHFNTIDEELEKAFKKFALSKNLWIEKCVVLFLDLIKIYPYEEESIDMAMIMLMYCLICKGCPIPELSVSQEEFNSLIAPYMDEKEDFTAFLNMFEKCIYNRLDAVVIFEKQALEQEL